MFSTPGASKCLCRRNQILSTSVNWNEAPFNPCLVRWMLVAAILPKTTFSPRGDNFSNAHCLTAVLCFSTNLLAKESQASFPIDMATAIVRIGLYGTIHDNR